MMIIKCITGRCQYSIKVILFFILRKGDKIIVNHVSDDDDDDEYLGIPQNFFYCQF